MRFFTIALIGLALCSMPGSAQAVEGVPLGPFVKIETSKTTLISPRCKRNADRLDCQFAATQIGKSAKNGECYIAVNSYPVSFTIGAAGRWTGTMPEPNCPLGRTDYKIELVGKNAADAQLTISGCANEAPSVLTHKANGSSWAPNCATISVGSHKTTDFIRQPK